MMFPLWIADERPGLFPPTILFQNIHFTVAVHIANAHAVREIPIAIVWRNGMPFPRLRRIGPIRLGVAILSFSNADQFRFAVAGQVNKRRRFVVGLIENFVASPMAFFASRIFVPGSVLPGKADN